VINTKKASVEEVKLAFKDLFGSSYKEDIFNTMSANLKQDLGLVGLTAKSRFNELISDTKSRLYSFILE
jgi:hypothetical protein